MFSLKDVAEIIKEMGFSVSQIRTSGGGALSQIWRQIHADVFNREVLTMSASAEGGAYGAALVAGVGSGVWSTIEEAVAFLQIESQDFPIPENIAVYEQLFEVYRRLYGVLKDSFRRISALN